MNTLRESVGAVAARILSRMTDQPRAAKRRRFRPLAEAMEARAVLSHVAVSTAIIGPIAVGRGSSAIVEGPRPAPDATSATASPALDTGSAARSGPGSMDTVVGNGQVEIQPD